MNIIYSKLALLLFNCKYKKLKIFVISWIDHSVFSYPMDVK